MKTWTKEMVVGTLVLNSSSREHKQPYKALCDIFLLRIKSGKGNWWKQFISIGLSEQYRATRKSYPHTTVLQHFRSSKAKAGYTAGGLYFSSGFE